MKRREVGYILLEECEIILIGNSHPNIGVWQNVELLSAPSFSEDNNVDVAHRELILRSENDTTLRTAYNIPPFGGVLSEITATQKSSSKNDNESSENRRRSDASLLAGLALEINNQSLAYQRHNENSDERASDDLQLLQLAATKIIFHASNFT